MMIDLVEILEATNAKEVSLIRGAAEIPGRTTMVTKALETYVLKIKFIHGGRRGELSMELSREFLEDSIIVTKYIIHKFNKRKEELINAR